MHQPVSASSDTASPVPACAVNTYSAVCLTSPVQGQCAAPVSARTTYQYNTVPSNKVHRTGTMFVYYKAPQNSVDSSIDTTIIVIYIVVIHMGNRVW